MSWEIHWNPTFAGRSCITELLETAVGKSPSAPYSSSWLCCFLPALLFCGPERKQLPPSRSTAPAISESQPTKNPPVLHLQSGGNSLPGDCYIVTVGAFSGAKADPVGAVSEGGDSADIAAGTHPVNMESWAVAAFGGVVAVDHPAGVVLFGIVFVVVAAGDGHAGILGGALAVGAGGRPGQVAVAVVVEGVGGCGFCGGAAIDELARIVGRGKERLGAVHGYHVGIFPILFLILAEGRVGDGHQCHDAADDNQHFQQAKAFIFPHVAALPHLWIPAKREAPKGCRSARWECMLRGQNSPGD